MITDLKDFEKFLKICRKQGVSDVTCNGISVKLGSLPNKTEADSAEEIETDSLTPDELMFYHLRDTTQ
jgi:hypothetical protein